MIIFLLPFFLLSLTFASSNFPQSDNGGFSVELIHRDSPKSPFYDPSKTPSQRLADAVTRSSNRVNRMKQALTSISPQAPTTYDGEYIMKFSLGTPPSEILAIVDTGSDIIWVQCKPCIKCFNQTGPLFNPKASSTYKPLRCKTTKCKSFPHTYCGNATNMCQYGISYGDGSFSVGDIVTDTITLSSTSGKSISYDKLVWGCGHANVGIFDKSQMGIFGLGATNGSLIIQKGHEIGGQKFSYCLAQSEQVTGTLSFGKAGAVSGPRVASTPLIIDGTYYKITLKAISVGKQRIKLPKKLATKGNALVDSGTPLSHLPKEVYDTVKSAVEKAGDLQSAPSIENLSCYYNTTAAFEAPVITMHFDGAKMKLPTLNTFIRAKENITCFAFVAVSEVLIGNIAQTNFLMGYNVEGKTLSFKSTDCSK